jgi:hypothetical protein
MTLKGYKASGDWDFKTCVYTVAFPRGGLGWGNSSAGSDSITCVYTVVQGEGCFAPPSFVGKGVGGLGFRYRLKCLHPCWVEQSETQPTKLLDYFTGLNLLAIVMCLNHPSMSLE